MMPMMGAMPMSPAAAPVSHCFYLSLEVYRQYRDTVILIKWHKLYGL